MDINWFETFFTFIKLRELREFLVALSTNQCYLKNQIKLLCIALLNLKCVTQGNVAWWFNLLVDSWLMCWTRAVCKRGKCK